MTLLFGQSVMNRHLRGLAALLFPSLIGCVSAPTTPPPSTIALPEGVSPPAPAPQWWRLYREPALDALVAQALADNRDLRAAAAHLLEARAMLEEARGARLPATALSAGAGAGSTLQDQIAAAGGAPLRSGSRFDLGADLSWEVDLFGRLRATVRLAQAQLGLSAAQADGVRAMIAADVTSAWATACGEAQQAAIARQSLTLARKAQDLAERRQAAGAGLPLDVAQAEGLVAQASAGLPPIEAARHNALARLAVLTGHVPDDVPPAAAACTRLPTLEGPVPLGDLLRRRPDLRAAEQRLAASTARIGIAVADLYPRITLGAGGAISSPTMGGLIARDNLVWRAGPLLGWSFPNLQSARARLRQSRAGEAAALAEFDAAILNALQEVNRTAVDYGAALARQTALRAAADSASRAHRLTLLQRAAGAATAQDALSAERADAGAQAALAAADLDVAAAQIALFRALGGGWDIATSSPEKTLP